MEKSLIRIQREITFKNSVNELNHMNLYIYLLDDFLILVKCIPEIHYYHINLFKKD